ncbi:GAP family protein [Micromonospora sp. NPDC048909]|uniref:GAP family protein n=1 Tax=Micromonospora sp. NPDC048909 TaxID=3155643 RepID=UPI00340A4D16
MPRCGDPGDPALGRPQGREDGRAAVGASAARHSLAWWHLLPFILLTVVLLAVPLLVLLLAGGRAGKALPRIRDWADEHAWVVSEVVIAFFALVTVLDLLR